MKKQIDPLDAHYMMVCKGKYNGGVINLLRAIHSVACGIPLHPIEKHIDIVIANRLYKIIQNYLPEKVSYLHELMHKWLWENRYPDKSPLENLIIFYSTKIWNINIREKKGDKHFLLYDFPKPLSKKVVARFLKGDTNFNDYKLLIK